MAASDDPRTTIDLPSETAFAIVRVYDAPRALVWEAISRPEHVRRWWGPRALELAVCEMDFRVGGRYRFVQRAPDGSLHPFVGEYREIVPPERVVQTQIYDVEPFASMVAVVTVTLEDLDGKTRLTSHVQHQNRAQRDGHLEGGRHGMVETMERLGELLESFR